MKNKEELLRELEAIKSQYGEWTYDIPLPFDIWTRGNLQLPHTRLRRFMQIVSDLAEKPLSECRVLDLACLDGIFSIELAKHGADTVGIEIRKANIEKAIFCKNALGLANLEFRQDDVRNISVESCGKFDAVFCSGILYHLTAGDAIDLISRMYEVVNRLVIIDTCVSLEPVERFIDGSDEYWGCIYREHSDNATPQEKAQKLWASADNPTSFWFTRPSLVNILNKAGFSSVYECFTPTHMNKPELGKNLDRCTFIAIKNDPCEIVTSPAVNAFHEDWPERSLSYAPEATNND